MGGFHQRPLSMAGEVDKTFLGSLLRGDLQLAS